jgi:hypothetical protein
MGGFHLLEEKKARILQRWLDRVLETYPAEFRIFLKEGKDPFSNPVGATIQRGITGLFHEMINSPDPAKVERFIDDIIHVQAVQGLSPSQAVAFIPRLKEILREELEKDGEDGQLDPEWSRLESDLDRLTLRAFDLYMQCREKIFQMQLKELRTRLGVG